MSHDFHIAAVDTEDCPLCHKKAGHPCVSRSVAVGECTLNLPHKARIKKYLKRREHEGKRVQVHFTERETEYADRGTGLVVDNRFYNGGYTHFLHPGHDPQDGTNQGYGLGIETGFGNDDRLMEDALDAEECRFCASKGVTCDYHAQYDGLQGARDKLAGELAIAVINEVECRYCRVPKGTPCLLWNHKKDKTRLYPHSIRYSDYHELKRRYIASTWKGAETSHDLKSNYLHPQQVLNSFYDIEERFPHPLTLGAFFATEGDPDNLIGKRIIHHGTVTGRINISEPERQELPVVSRKEVLTRAAEKALEDLQQYAIFGDDVYEDETVLMVRYKHNEYSDKTYSYVAVKLEGKWYVTGYQNEGPKTWDRLVELFLSHGEVVDIWINSGWEQIIE